MNKLNKKNEIIIALATPYGKSAVAVIRISGAESINAVNRFLSRPVEIGKMRLCKFSAEKFTENLMTVGFEAPHSYTGEETVELYPHGNMTVCDGIIKTLISAGMRQAERGEFTKRAFFNGKLDLMKCEALADIIDAQTAEQLVYGNKRYDGEFKALPEAELLLKKALSSIEAVLHYSDELEDNEIDQALMNDVYCAIEIAACALNREVEGFAGGKIIKDGFKVALIGVPNVGKSMLLNALTDSDIAIVTEIAGTTRDAIDGEYVYNGRKFIITDTAGINDYTHDKVEKIGMERALAKAESADAVVFVTDSADECNIGITKESERSVYVINKCDDEPDVGSDYRRAQAGEKLKISAKFGKNIVALKQKLFDLCPKEFGSVCNHRQYACVKKCLDCLTAAKAEAAGAQSLEIVAALLYEAYSAIAELHGERADEQVISDVFERFCVGK